MAEDGPQVYAGFVELPNESTLYREKWFTPHQGTRRTMIFIHGLCGTTNIFHPAIKPLLAALPYTTIITYDWSASGLSPWPKASRDCEERATLVYSRFVEDLDALITKDAHLDGPIVLVAHSVGSFVVAHWLLSQVSAVSRVTHTIFLGGPRNPPEPAERAAGRLQIAELLEQNGPGAVVDPLLPLLVGPTSFAKRPLAVTLVRSVVMSHTVSGTPRR